MGAHSTLRMTPEEARMIAMRFIMGASNDQLEQLLDPILDDRLYTARICDCEDRDEWEQYVVAWMGA